jgi:hypothetical protein
LLKRREWVACGVWGEYALTPYKDLFSGSSTGRRPE